MGKTRNNDKRRRIIEERNEKEQNRKDNQQKKVKTGIENFKKGKFNLFFRENVVKPLRLWFSST